MKRALILGGGIQGCCISLMLKKHDYEVSIIEKSDGIINRASINQEGKIHLGFNYGMDKSLKTGKKLMLDALNFAPYLEYLLDKKVNWENYKSFNFNYLITKDSMLSPEEVNTYFEFLQDTYSSFLENKKLNYLGKRPKRIFQKASIPSKVNPNFFQACFATEEAALYPESIKEIIKEKILSESISLLLNQNITRVKRTQKGFMVETRQKNGNICQIDADVVFNCLGEGKFALDKEMGLYDRNINFRFKFRIPAKIPKSLDELGSFTIIKGPYGDFVNYPQRKEASFCWYPSSIQGMVVDQNIPANWEEFSEGNIPNALKQKLVNDNLEHFRRLIPTLSEFKEPLVRGGVIVAKGNSDIDDRESTLHQRSDFPIFQNDGYFSINTGKYTSAPHNTSLLEKMLGYKEF